MSYPERGLRVPIAAVITADFVSRTEANLSQKTLAQNSKLAFEDLARFLGDGAVLQSFQMSRGDSYQGVLHNARQALKAALFLRLQLLTNIQLDVRQAIGIGPTEELVGESPLESSGTAFVRSGRLLDEMSSRKKPHQRIAVDSGDMEFDSEFLSQFELLEAILSDWTEKEGEAILLRMQAWTQTQIADHLSIDQSAVNRRLRSAHWDAITVLLDRWNLAIVKLEDSQERSKSK